MSDRILDPEITDQVRARQAAEAARERFAMLAQVSAVLGGSLDYEGSLGDLARLLVPILGDFSSVSLIDPGGAIRRLADAAVNEDLGAGVTRVRTAPVPAGMIPFLQEVLEGGRARVFADFTAEFVGGLPEEEPYVLEVREIGVRATVFAPLCARGRALGYLSFGRVFSDRPYEPDDVALIEAVAERAALAIDTARLFCEAEAQRARLQQVFTQAPVPIAILRGPDHVIELLNARAADRFGARDALGKPMRLAVPELERQRFIELLDRVYATGEPFIGTELIAELDRRGDGRPEVGYYDLVYQPMRDAAGNVEGIISISFDVTERVLARRREVELLERIEAERQRLLARERQAREAAEEANELKDQFLATVSHELRTPLNAMLGWTRMLRSGQIPPERRERALETVERNARMQAQLVEDLLDISRIISGKLRIEVHPVDLVEVAEAALETVRPAAHAKRIRLTPLLGSGAAAVLGDAARLEQVTWNLLSNAIKFTPEGGGVEIRIERVGSAVELVVIDTGKGIDPEFLPYVFERFRQAEGGTTRAHGGLGLGLSIVKSLVELHGGTIRALSEGKGAGATFIVRLPLAPIRDRAIASRPSPRPSPDAREVECPPELRGLRVLVVEDEDDGRDLVVALLQGCGARVTGAASVAEALTALGRERPHLVVADIAMPDEDGYALIRKIRALPAEEGGRTLVVALTAHARSEDRTRALRAGFNMHVPKPVDPAELLAVIASLAPHDR